MNTIIKNIFLVALVPVLAEVGMSSHLNASELLPAVQSYMPNLNTIMSAAHTYMPHMANSFQNLGAGLGVAVGSLASLKSLWWVYRIFCSDD